ncbi:hypothetical protein HPG69_008428, partial [Diceros bicornis minor]
MDPKRWCVELNDGYFIPVPGFGTYAPEEVPKSKAADVTKLAINAGFRHIDSAFMYNNEEELWLTFLRPELVRTALEKSLKKLQLDYVFEFQLTSEDMKILDGLNRNLRYLPFH